MDKTIWTSCQIPVDLLVYARTIPHFTSDRKLRLIAEACRAALCFSGNPRFDFMRLEKPFSPGDDDTPVWGNVQTGEEALFQILDILQTSPEKNACCNIFREILGDPFERYSTFAVGDTVKAQPNSALRCGSGHYDFAIVVSLTPFVLASPAGDMLWGTLPPSAFQSVHIPGDYAPAFERWQRDADTGFPSPSQHWRFLDRSCLTPIVVQIARSIYFEQTFDDMPILADALEDAGCADTMLLKHLRKNYSVVYAFAGATGKFGTYPSLPQAEAGAQEISDHYRGHADVGIQRPGHVRGCWVLDLLLGKG